MKINGHDIAESIYTDLRERVEDLEKKGITPQLVVLLVGGNPGSIAYVNQKELSGAKVGAKVTIKRYTESITTEELEKVIKELNVDRTVHGILIQRPLPPQVDVKKLELLTNPQKDIDGFHPDSPYTLPLPLAILKILEIIFRLSNPERSGGSHDEMLAKVSDWIKHREVVILGKGETGGKPIINYFHKLNIEPTVIDSKTEHPETIMKNADIVISAVGRSAFVKPESLKQNVILLGVGMTQGEGKRIHGDYKEEAIDHIASYYTPTPRGVGPVNVAMLLDNLITAAEKQTQQ